MATLTPNITEMDENEPKRNRICQIMQEICIHDSVGNGVEGEDNKK